jgi:hypothetical protein
MTDLKTSVTGLVTALAAITATYGLELGADIQNAIIYIGIVLLGFFAKDSK